MHAMEHVDLEFACHCSAVAGRLHAVSARRGRRIVCHCDDCQVFAQYLDRAGDVLDAQGGTDVFQTDAWRLELGRGTASLACIRVTDGPTVRWYCNACRTPLFNTLDRAKRSFLSVILYRVDTDRREAVLGPVTGHLCRQFGRGDCSGLPAASWTAMLFRIAARMAAARISGSYRDTPLFDAQSGQPIATPALLSAGGRRIAEEELEQHFRTRR